MRMTVDLDDDVAERIARLRREGASLKEIVDKALRRGLQEINAQSKRKGSTRKIKIDAKTRR
jgi:metal-responsive CopG/Arc/MetJ family transcriptional regulator